ncbi:MAG: prolipoprotein diacylglyceryl transferase [Sedimentisphaerales bacterium]|nr:prolipoprotein diacylglyceryl transferase [Sedimentisphaerales bacterium]
MHPELFRIPFTELTVKSYGVMMAIGFIAAIYVIRRLSRGMDENAEHITSAALYSLIAGIVGSRLFYVIHYWYQFRGKGIIEMFAVWKGGLELLGGVLLAILVIAIYLYVNKLPVRRYLDILAVGLMLALAFGRIGCFFNGCCFGKPTRCPIAVRFPYGSIAYHSQIWPDNARNRKLPYVNLPAGYFTYVDDGDESGLVLKPFDQLTDEQKLEVTEGQYRPLAVHPTQLYSSASALMVCILLYMHRKKEIVLQKRGKPLPIFFRPGVTFALMFILYGITRFFLEYLRDDNPIQANNLTISQNLSIANIFIGFLLMWLFAKMKPDKLPAKNSS